MQLSAIRLALLGAATAILAGCATGVPTDVAWSRQSAHDQHLYMPDPAAVAAQDTMSDARTMGGPADVPPPPAAQAIQDGDTVRLVSQEEYARLRSDPRVLGAPPATAAPKQ